MSSKNKFCTFLCISFLDIPRIMCSQPKCDAGCRINYETKPCPSCECSDGKKKYIVSLLFQIHAYPNHFGVRKLMNEFGRTIMRIYRKFRNCQKKVVHLFFFLVFRI